MFLCFFVLFSSLPFFALVFLFPLLLYISKPKLYLPVEVCGKYLCCKCEFQISFEPAFGAYQGLVQKIDVLFCTMFCLSGSEKGVWTGSVFPLLILTPSDDSHKAPIIF